MVTFSYFTFQALETVNNNKSTYEKTAKDIKEKYTAQKDEMTKTVTDSINKILDEKIQEVDRIYDPACQKLTVHAEMILYYLQKVKNSLQRSDDALENSKVKELLLAQKDIDREIQMLQNLISVQIQVETPGRFEERLCFYTIFKGLTDKCTYTNCLHFMVFISRGKLPRVKRVKGGEASKIWKHRMLPTTIVL